MGESIRRSESEDSEYGAEGMSEFKRITEMFAFVAEDSLGEGVVGMRMPTGVWIPPVGADMDRVESLKIYARQIAKESGQKIRLIKLTTREDLGEV
jgi:hypothetical protein